MRAGPVVVNNTPLVGLWLLDRLDLLRLLYGSVLIPREVRNEFLAADSSARRQKLEKASWIAVRTVSGERRVLSYTGLDRGEAEVLALAEEVDASLVILDERKGRKYAQRMGFSLTGTLGVLLVAKERGHLASLEQALATLASQGFHLHPALVQEALRLANEA